MTSISPTRSTVSVEFIRPQNTSLTGSLPLSMAARNAS